MTYRARVADWIAGIEARFGVTVAEIAARSSLQPSTIYRWLDDKSGHMPSHVSVARIANAFKIPPPTLSDASNPGFSETPVTMTDAPADEPAGENLSWWRVGDRALELAGFLPGDRVLLDQAQQARAGDVVIAQIYDFERGAADTRLRWYDPPFLVTRTMDPALAGKPILVDGERVVIMGPIVRLLRDRFA